MYGKLNGVSVIGEQEEGSDYSAFKSNPESLPRRLQCLGVKKYVL